MEILEAVIIGGGQFGLGTSYLLKQKGVPHVVLEKERVGDSWRSQRWDSFHLNTIASMSLLPGDSAEGIDPDAFLHRDAFVRYLEAYAYRNQLPVREGAAVTAVEPGPNPGTFAVQTKGETLYARNVVVASGSMHKAHIPLVSREMPSGLPQVHTAWYRHPDQLPEGAVLVVGSAQSGVQIVEDLLDHDRKVYLATSRVARVPRRYRGRDLNLWMRDIGMLEHTPADLEDMAMVHWAQPQVSGTHGGHTVSLQGLARQGVVLTGHLQGVENGDLVFDDQLPAHLAFGDLVSAKIKAGIDMYIEKAGLDAPPPENDPADLPDEKLAGQPPVTRLNPRAEGIGCVVWCTGFTADYGWLHLPALDEMGLPKQSEGISELPGLYFLGIPWQRKRKSALICGVEDDASHIIAHMLGRS